jgi:hypothetical protein
MQVSDLCGLNKTFASLGIDRRCVECDGAATAGKGQCKDCYAAEVSRSLRRGVPGGPSGRTDIDKAWGY